MRLGALLGPVLDASDARALPDQARRLEDEGFESLWSAQAVGRGFMITDPLIALAVAATATERVELGTAVVQLPLYPPLDLAHRVLSLQQVCGGRLRLGVGVGSTENDFRAFGRDFATRFRVFRENIGTLREALAGHDAGDGELSPWPAIVGGPPLLYGTWGKGVVEAATSYDGWIASGMHRSPDEVIEALGRYREAGGQRAIVSTILLTGETDLGELGALLGRYADAGMDDAVVMFQPGAPAPADVRKLLS